MGTATEGRRVIRTELAPYPNGSGGMSKREKYGWAPLPREGQFMRIEKDKLYIDDAYQREVRTQKVQEFAAQWEWIKCGCLVVVRRADGSYYVVDGQHRALGAASRDDIHDLPCLVFEVESLSEEARAFVALNTTKSAVPLVARHRANVVGRDDLALQIDALLTRAGLKFAPGGGGSRTIQAIGLVYKIMRANPELAERTIVLMREIAAGEAINGFVLDALFWIAQRDSTVLGDSHAPRLVQLGQSALLAEITRHRVIAGKGGAAMDARPIITLLNKGRRTHKLQIDGKADS